VAIEFALYANGLHADESIVTDLGIQNEEIDFIIEVQECEQCNQQGTRDEALIELLLLLRSHSFDDSEIIAIKGEFKN